MRPFLLQDLMRKLKGVGFLKSYVLLLVEEKGLKEKEIYLNKNHVKFSQVNLLSLQCFFIGGCFDDDVNNVIFNSSPLFSG